MDGGNVDPTNYGAPNLGGVEDLLAMFLAPEPQHLTDGETLDAVVALDRLRCLVDAALAGAVDHFDGRALCGADGMRSSQAWLRTRTEMASAHASSVVLLARGLRESAPVQAAYRNGIVGTAKVKMLLTARVGVETVFVDHVAALIANVRDLTVAEAQTVVDRWREIALATMAEPSDDDGPVPDPEDSNALFLSPTLGGRYKLDGDLDAVTGEATANAIDAEVAEWFRTGASTADDGETPRHRRARALADLVARGALPCEQQGRARPSVTVNIDLAEYLGLAIDDPSDLLGRRCGLANGTPINRRTAERLLCEADVTALLTRVGFDGIVHPLGVAHAKRYPTPSERRALALRDEGCVFPGCDARVEWTDAHHLDHWHLHHRTELARLVLLCRYHHHCVHEGGYQLDRDEAGAIDVLRPDGTRITRAGPGHLVREPVAFGATAGAGPPGQPRSAPTRPRSRFRTLAQRRGALGLGFDWEICDAKEGGIRLVAKFGHPDSRTG